MRRKVLVWALVVLMLLSVLPPGMAAEGRAGTAVFESSAPDGNGLFTVTFSVKDTTFRVAQFILRYDPSVIQPVDAKGAPTTKFGPFATLDASWLKSVGTTLNSETGFFEFCVYVGPDTEADEVQTSEEHGTQAVIGSEGLQIYTFRFKRLKDGDTGLQIATEQKGEPYQKACPQGVILTGNGEEQEVSVSFVEADKPDSGTSESFAPAEPYVPEKTADDLLKEVVILSIGSHAAVAGGNVAAIYPGERMVTAYAHDNRTFVPVRFVGERLKATVGWEQETQTVTVDKDDRSVAVAVGALTYTLNGEEKALDVPAEYTESTNGNYRTMVPIRFVSEALGYQVEWDSARNLVIIAPASVGWDVNGSAEAEAMDKAVGLLMMYSNFV